VRRAVFICGETDVIVPWMIVPFLSSIVTVSFAHFIKNLPRSKESARSVAQGPDELHRDGLLSFGLEVGF